MRLGIDNRIIRIELKAQLDLRLQVCGLGLEGSSWHATVVKKKEIKSCNGLRAKLFLSSVTICLGLISAEQMVGL